MATTKPRITISLEPEIYAALKRLAALQRRPMSTSVTELLVGLLPVVTQVIQTLEYVQKADEKAREQLREPLKQLLKDLEPLEAVALKFGKIVPDGQGEG